jgi:uncharacterized membrane protein
MSGHHDASRSSARHWICQGHPFEQPENLTSDVPLETSHELPFCFAITCSSLRDGSEDKRLTKNQVTAKFKVSNLIQGFSMLPRGLIGDVKPENWLGMIDAIYAIILTFLLIELPAQIMEFIQEYELHPNLQLITLENLAYHVIGYFSIFIIIYDIWAHHRVIVTNAVINRVNLSIGIAILFLSSLMPPLHHIVMELKSQLMNRENSSIGDFSFIFDDVRSTSVLVVACIYGCIALIAAKDIRFLRRRGSEADSRMIVLKHLRSSSIAMMCVIFLVGIVTVRGHITPPVPLVLVALCTHLPIDKLMIQLKQRISSR